MEVNMKVLMLNGSPHANGNTYVALHEMEEVFHKEGIETEIYQIGVKPIRDCIGCGKCTENGCIFDDDICNDLLKKAKEADGFVFGSPVYYAHPSGRILSLLDRVFYCGGRAFAFKPCASVTVARRAGTSTTFDVLNKYATISNMIVVGSSYWNNVFGRKQGEAVQDLEGLQTMRNLAMNMAYLMKCLKAGEEKGVKRPEPEYGFHTNFIR